MNLTIPHNLSKPVAALFAVGVTLAIGAFIVSIAAVGAFLGVTYAVILGALLLGALWAASGADLRVLMLRVVGSVIAVPAVFLLIFGIGFGVSEIKETVRSIADANPRNHELVARATAGPIEVGQAAYL